MSPRPPNPEPPEIPPAPEGLLPETVAKWEWFWRSGEAMKSKNPSLEGFRKLFRLYDQQARIQAAIDDAGGELPESEPGGWN